MTALRFVLFILSYLDDFSRGWDQAGLVFFLQILTFFGTTRADFYVENNHEVLMMVMKVASLVWA